MKKIEHLGIFDSGLGGYTVFKDLKDHFPLLSMTLLADQKNAPYGNYENQEIINLTKIAMQWFLDKGIHDVLLACNTATSVALKELQETFTSMRIWGIIDITLEQLPTSVEKVGMVGTVATVDSHAYKELYDKKYNGELIEKPLKDLALAIENLDSSKIIDEMLQPLKETMEGCSHLILGCTHYPLVMDNFKHILKGVILLDSRLPIRQFIENNYIKSKGKKRVYTTLDAKKLKKQIRVLYNEKEKVEIADGIYRMR